MAKPLPYLRKKSYRTDPTFPWQRTAGYQEVKAHTEPVLTQVIAWIQLYGIKPGPTLEERQEAYGRYMVLVPTLIALTKLYDQPSGPTQHQHEKAVLTWNEIILHERKAPKSL